MPERGRQVAQRRLGGAFNPAHWPITGEQYGWVALPSEAGLYGMGVWWH